MPGTSTYFGNSILNYLRGQAMPTPPSAVYVALFNGDPEAGGTEVTTSVRSAGRVVGTFSAPSGKKIVNTGDIDFGNSAGQAIITHIAIMDAASGGNIMLPKQISAQRQVAQGDPVRYPAGNLALTI